MKRWFISRFEDWGDGNGFDAKVGQYANVSYRLWALPNRPWCFGQLATNNLQPLQDDPDIYIMPDGVMDMSVGSIPSQTRQTMRTRLEAAGFTFADVKLTWTVRELLHYICHQVQAGINIEAGDVVDIE